MPMAGVHLLPTAVELGFQFHHADARGAVLTLWLPEDEPSGLPCYPHIGHGVRALIAKRARCDFLGTLR
eukprot:SAG11_NODE_7996_length_1072_cov_1.130524_2_plen_69_part_00